MALGDIRAGRAFVELGTDHSKLIAGLRAGLRRVRSFVEEAGAISRRVALVGIASTIGLFATARAFANTGAELARLRDQTGLTAEALSGLSRAAADNDIPFDAIKAAMTALQKATANGGKDVEEALARIGLTLEDLRRMRPDDVLDALADRLPRVRNEAERVATVAALMGRRGAEMLAIFKGGSVSLKGVGSFQALREEFLALETAVERGGPKVEGALSAIGLSIGELRAMSTEDALALVDSRLPKIESAAKRAAAALALLGRSRSDIRTTVTASVDVPDELPKFEALKSAMTTLQVTIKAGGGDVDGVLGRIGTSLEKLRAMRPDDALALVLKGLPRIRSEAERATAAVALLGRSGAGALDELIGGTVSVEGVGPLNDLRSSMAALQRAIARGGPEVEGALGRMGLALEDVRRRRLDDVLDAVASRLPRIRSESERAAAALALLGRAGVQRLRAVVTVDAPKGFPGIDSLRSAMSELQKAVARGAPNVQKALSRIGIPIDELRKMRPDDALALVTDRLPRIESDLERTAAAMALLGREGPAMLRSLSGGAAGLRAAADAARRAGTALNEDALSAAEEVDDAFDRVADATKGLGSTIAQVTAGPMGSIVDSFARAVEGATMWIKANPELARSMVGLTIGVTALASGLAVLAAVLAIVTAETFLLTAAIAASIAVLGAYVAAALAVTDVLGITATGFGDLFNSIRVGGQGLATWFAKLWTFMRLGWEVVTTKIASTFDVLVTAGEFAGGALFAALVWVPRKLLEAFRVMVDGVNSILAGLAKAWNDTVGSIAGEIEAGQIGTVTVTRWIKALEETERTQLTKVRENVSGFAARQGDRDVALGRRIIESTQTVLALDAADPDDGSLLGFDAERAKRGIARIGTSILDGLQKVLDSIGPDELKVPAVDRGEPLEGLDGLDDLQRALEARDFPAIREAIAPEVETRERVRQIDTVTTFNASAAGRLGFGSRIEERQARAAETTAKNTRDILDELRNNGASAAVYGA